MDRRWVVLRTQPRHERLATQAVHGQGVESYVPLLPPKRRSRSATPLFPGYLFARITVGSDDLLRIRSAPGIAYVLPLAGPPALLTDAVVSAIRRRLGEPSDDVIRQRFKPGDRVQVAEGPFRWVEAVFDRRLNAAGRVRILLDFVDRSVPVELDEEHLARVG